MPDPKLPRLLSRATAALQAARPQDALPHLRQAARLDPSNAALLHDLGLACLECGRVPEAVATLRRAIAAAPAYGDAHLRLAIALEASGAFDAALASYQAAAQLLEDPADALYRKADLLDSLGRSSAAMPAFRAAAAVAPGSTLGLVAAARALLAEDRDAEAETLLLQALDGDPGNAAALTFLGNLRANAGRFAEARANLHAAIRQSPRLAGNFYDIARCGRIGPQDATLVEEMRAALRWPLVAPAQRARIHLALGKAADDLGDRAEAMRQFDAAARLRASVTRFSLAAFDTLVDRLIARFTPQVMAQARHGNSDPAPVLILGLPRSGTTLTEHILSAHPEVAAGGELSFWGEAAQRLQPAAALPDAAALAETACAYLALLRGIGPAAARVTDKMPLNFLRAGLIHLALPNAVMIHCRRNLLDTALSIHQTHFNPRMAFPTGGADLVGYIRAYQRLTTHWRAVLPADRFIDVEYETLTASPETEIRRLLDAIGLPWDPACLHPERNARVVKTASKWQARQPIYRNAAGRWRSYVDHLGPLTALRDAP